MSDHYLLHCDYQSDWTPNHDLAAPDTLPWAVYSNHPTTYRWTEGTIVWLITVPSGIDAGPSICGRLVVEGLKLNIPASTGYDPRYPTALVGFRMKVAASRYMRPARCLLLDALFPPLSAHRGPIPLFGPVVAELEKFWSAAAAAGG